MVSTGDVEPATVVHNLRQALDAIGGLSSERASLEQVSGLAHNAQPAGQPRGSPETGSSVASHPDLNSLLSSAPPPGPCSLCSAAPCIHRLPWLINCSLPYARQADLGPGTRSGCQACLCDGADHSYTGEEGGPAPALARLPLVSLHAVRLTDWASLRLGRGPRARGQPQPALWWWDASRTTAANRPACLSHMAVRSTAQMGPRTCMLCRL